jgi:hypothetical protein
VKNSISNFIDKKLLVIMVVAIYSFIAISHLYYLPGTNQPFKRTFTVQNSIFKRRTENLNVSAKSINYLQRTDKFTVNDKKSAADFLNAVVGCFILLLFTLQLWKLNLRPYRNFFRPNINHQYVYLSLCTFRI